MDIRKLLAGVKEGEVSLEEAEQVLRRAPFEEMGFAKLDTHRELRSGFPEVIFCAGKPDTFLVDIYRRMAEENGSAFGTRASAHQFALVKEILPEVEYDPISRILRLVGKQVYILSRRTFDCIGSCFISRCELPGQRRD